VFSVEATTSQEGPALICVSLRNKFPGLPGESKRPDGRERSGRPRSSVCSLSAWPLLVAFMPAPEALDAT
jgi:hypothetical protein